MKPSLSIKTLYRAPVKTILTFVLLAAVTFAFFSQVGEYAITERELANAAGQYIGVGTAEIAEAPDIKPVSSDYMNADPRVASRYSEEERAYYLDELRYQPLSREQLDAISGLPYITSFDTRYMTVGVSDTYYRPDDGSPFYNYTTRCIVEGTLAEIKYGASTNLMGSTEEGEFYRFDWLVLNDCTPIAGAGDDWSHDYATLLVESNAVKPYMRSSVGGSERSVTYTHDYIYDTAYLEGLTPGNRYVFVLRFDPLEALPNVTEGRQKYTLYLYDHLAEPWCGSIWPVTGAPDDYLETEEYAPLRELVEITNADIHTFDMVYTDDMSTIPRFAEGQMVIADGRALTPEDGAGGASVCVVSRDFAEANGLGVGDTLTVRLGTELFEQYKGLGAVAGTRERYSPAEKAVTLEIVGVYADTDGASAQARQAHRSYSVSTVFVPKSLLPVDESTLDKHMFSPAEFSFKVENAWDIPAFLEESAPAFTEMGLTLVFSDGGWTDIVDNFQSAKQLSLIRIVILAAAVAAATGFTVYLFIGRKKKEYAIMRALGTPRHTSARALTVPLMAVTALAVLVGSAVAWVYTVTTVAGGGTLAMLEERSANASIPATVAIGCILGEFALALLIAIVLLRRISALPPLLLLQDGGTGRAGGKRA
ncbi:MAG: ABC transporter permease [Oscillospiraceae bacterium]|jgi:hypothetical protein|nr:ABC transporter permease [Oscillospiraceae bacterium]